MQIPVMNSLQDEGFVERIFHTLHELSKRQCRMERITFVGDLLYDDVTIEFQIRSTVPTTNGQEQSIFARHRLQSAEEKQAFDFSLYIIAHSELLNFHPLVRNNPSHIHNSSPIYELNREKSLFFTNINGVRTIYQGKTKKTERLSAVEMSRELLLKNDTTILLCVAHNNDIGLVTSDLIRVEQRFISTYRDKFLSICLRKEQDILLTVSMARHMRLGASSMLSLLEEEIFKNICTCFRNINGDQLVHFLRGMR